MVDGSGICQLGLHIDLAVVVGHPDPGLSLGKAAVRSRGPLHRRAAVIPGPGGQDSQCLLAGLPLPQKDLVVVQALHIPILGDIGEMGIRHPQLLSLVEIGGPPHQVEGRRQHLGGLLPVPPLVAEAADDPGLVVVAPEEGVPAVSCLHPGLPLLKKLL